MLRLDRPEFGKALKTCFDTLSRPFEESTIENWWMALRKFDLAVVKAALTAYASTNVYAPKPADIVTLVKTLSPKGAAPPAYEHRVWSGQDLLCAAGVWYATGPEAVRQAYDDAMVEKLQQLRSSYPELEDLRDAVRAYRSANPAFLLPMVSSASQPREST